MSPKTDNFGLQNCFKDFFLLISLRGMFRNKQGKVFHFLFFGILAAMALFSSLYFDNFQDIIVQKGVAYESTRDHFFDTQRLGMQVDQFAWDSYIESLRVLGSGEYLDVDGFENACGDVDGIPLWNLGDRFCFIESDLQLLIFSSLFEKQFDAYFNLPEQVLPVTDIEDNGEFEANRLYIVNPDVDFSYGLSSQGISGKSSGRFTVMNEGALVSLSFDPSFAVESGFSLADDLKLVQSQVLLVLSSCQGSSELDSCLVDAIPSSWKEGSCGQGAMLEDSVRLFCVQSPSGIFFPGSLGDDNLEALEYSFALDFGGEESLFVSGLSGEYFDSEQLVEFSFDVGDSGFADSYVLYLTDYRDLDFFGDSRVFNDLRFASDVFENIELTVLESCVDSLDRENGFVYLCGDELVGSYQLADDFVLFEGKGLYIAATLVDNGYEGDINGFVVLE